MSKKNKWKQLLKPIVKECIVEVLIENGIKESIGQITDGLLEETFGATQPQNKVQSSFSLSGNGAFNKLKESMRNDFSRPVDNSVTSTPKKPSKPVKNDITGTGANKFDPLGNLSNDDAGEDISFLLNLMGKQ